MNFYTTEHDKVVIANILNSIFGELIDVPRYAKNNISPFNIQIEKRYSI